MDVGVGQRDGETIDADHQHVRVRRADVVLDQEPALVLDRGRAEARMAEL